MSKENTEQIVDIKPTPKVEKTEAAIETKSSAILSTSFNAKIAIQKLGQLQTSQEVQDYVIGDQRKTVLERATARMNSFQNQKEK